MARYVGVKHNRICVVADSKFNNSDLDILEVPPELSHISASDLIVHAKIADGKLKYKNIKKSTNQIKLALVGNWKMRCGISTHSENLWPEIAKHVGDFKLFIEENEFPTGDTLQFGDQYLTSDKVSVCWERGESLQTLIAQLKEYDPDIILIQHEFGLWPNAAYWLSMMTQLSDYRVIVIMHSVFPQHQDKTIVEAAMPEIIVHLPGAQHALNIVKGISRKVHVVPHGCYDYQEGRLWNFYKTEHTVIQAGFLFRYKGWQESLRAIAILKEKYPDIFFTGICSESPYAKTEHQIYYNELMNLIEELKIQENVALIRGYQSDIVLDSYFRTNVVALFPYVSHPEHEVFGASGAARLAMSKGLAVVSSKVNHFSDLPTIKADTSQEMANEIDKLFSDSSLMKLQIEKQKQYMQDNSWTNTALKFIKIFEE